MPARSKMTSLLRLALFAALCVLAVVPAMAQKVTILNPQTGDETSSKLLPAVYRINGTVHRAQTVQIVIRRLTDNVVIVNDFVIPEGNVWHYDWDYSPLVNLLSNLVQYRITVTSFLNATPSIPVQADLGLVTDVIRPGGALNVIPASTDTIFVGESDGADPGRTIKLPIKLTAFALPGSFIQSAKVVSFDGFSKQMTAVNSLSRVGVDDPTLPADPNTLPFDYTVQGFPNAFYFYVQSEGVKSVVATYRDPSVAQASPPFRRSFIIDYNPPTINSQVDTSAGGKLTLSGVVQDRGGSPVGVTPSAVKEVVILYLNNNTGFTDNVSASLQYGVNEDDPVNFAFTITGTPGHIITYRVQVRDNAGNVTIGPVRNATILP